MKIAILSAFYPYRGGIAQFSGALFRALENTHTVRTYNFTTQYPSFLFPGETQFVKPEDNADQFSSERILNSVQPLTYYKTAKVINSFHPDLFISNYWMTFFGPSMGTVARKLKPETKRIAILHNVIPHEKRFFDSAANRYFLKNHDGFIVLSDAVEKDLLQLKPDAKVLKIDHPVYSHFGSKISRVDAMQQLNLNPEKKTILFFGIIRDYKGLDLLLDAFSKLDESYQLIVAGESYGSFEKYKAQINVLNIEKRIHLFTRYISDQEVPVFFSAADVCVLPYKSATQSGITAISHHFEVPVIATDVGGLKETVQHTKNGLIVAQPNAGLITQAIESYFSEDYRSLFSAKIALDNKENSWQNFADKVIDFACKSL